MNDINKHKVTGQMNHQTADPKSQRFCIFLFFPPHIFKTILASHTNGTFGFTWHKADPSLKPKAIFILANATENHKFDNLNWEINAHNSKQSVSDSWFCSLVQQQGNKNDK